MAIIKYILIVSALLISLGLVSGIEFNGTITDEAGIPLNNSIINITIRSMTNWAVIGYNFTNCNESGWFNISLASGATYIYEPIILHRNGSFVDYRSKSLPSLQAAEISMLAGANFYLTAAGTVNITAINSTGGRTSFMYQIKDTKLGYPISQNFDSHVLEANIYVPKNRNYSVMVYPNQSMPVSFNWDNFTSSNSYVFGTNNISLYNATTSMVRKQFNLTLSMPRVSGYINYTGINGWNEFNVVAFLVEPGNMVHATYGAMPYNLSAFNSRTDLYNLSTGNINRSGFYNITLPATVESSTLLLFATARNGSVYYGGFKNASLSYSVYASGGEMVGFNFTMLSGLLGSYGNISMDRAGAEGKINATTSLQSFYFINSTNSSVGNIPGHIEARVDYSSLGAIEFTWMDEVSQTSAVSYFSLPLLNTTSVKEMNIFLNGGQGGGQFSPKRISSWTPESISSSSNITVKLFNPQDIEGSVSSGRIYIELFKSNSTCDAPNPGSSCSLGGAKNMNSSDSSGFNPIRAVMGGGKISFRMGVGGILVHYVNVDMLASGPPDALFDSSATNSTSSVSFNSAVRFGSSGPTIYDYILVSMPYDEGTSSVAGLNESRDINMSIPVIYDENWNVIWNSSRNGTAGGALAGNFSHYSSYSSEWQTLMGVNNCTVNVSELNSSRPCFIDKTNNKIWIRLPHFSGTGPSVTGSATSVASSSSTPTSSGSSGTGDLAYWTFTQALTNEQFEKGYTIELGLRKRVRFNLGNESHYAGIVGVSNGSALINVSSSPIQIKLDSGGEAKLDINNDRFYDAYIKVNSIKQNAVSITIKKINEAVPEEKGATDVKGGEVVSEQKEIQKTAEETSFKWLWILAGIIVLIGITIGFAFYKGRKKRYCLFGY